MIDPYAFHLAVQCVQRRDPRYAFNAYAFLCEALEFTTKDLGRAEKESRHVTGQELMAGFRKFALQEFGPLAWLVMREWGVSCSEDVGNMVYNLINVRYFGRNDTDRIEDFSDGISLEGELTKPYVRYRRSAK